MEMLLRGNILYYRTIMLICVVIKIYFFSHIKASYICQKDQLLSKVCESPCITQVGLSVVRVTFSDFLVNSECVKTTFITYWKSNTTHYNPIDVQLDNRDVWKQDCTYGMQKTNNFISQPQVKPTKQSKEIPNLGSKHIVDMDTNDKYMYLHGLSIGETYSFKLRIELNKGVDSRTEFSSPQDTITLTSNRTFKDDGLVGNVNQGSCCDVRSMPYVLNKDNGECMLKVSPYQDTFSLNTFMFSLLIFCLLVVVVANMIFHFKKFLTDRRYYQTSRIDAAEVSFKYTNQEEMHPDILMSTHRDTNQRYHTMNESLVKHSTITIRLPPHNDDFLIEELKSRLTRQSI